MSFDLPALVENFMDCPLDCTTNESDMQDGELAGIILYYTFEALSQANHGLDNNFIAQTCILLQILCSGAHEMCCGAICIEESSSLLSGRQQWKPATSFGMLCTDTLDLGGGA